MKRYRAKEVYDFIVETYVIPLRHEVCFVVILDDGGSPTTAFRVARGDSHSIPVTKDMQRMISAMTGERYFVLVHNHPSGSLEASDEDVEFTKNFRARTGKKFVDHMIITPDGYRSVW